MLDQNFEWIVFNWGYFWWEKKNLYLASLQDLYNNLTQRYLWFSNHKLGHFGFVVEEMYNSGKCRRYYASQVLVCMWPQQSLDMHNYLIKFNLLMHLFSYNIIYIHLTTNLVMSNLIYLPKKIIQLFLFVWTDIYREEIEYQ